MSVFENSVMIVQKKTPLRWLIEGILLVAGICLLVAMILFFRPYLFLPVVVIFVAFYLVHKYNYIEYEYTYIEGQLDVDRIYAKSRRKSVAKIDMEDLILIAPEGSRDTSNYERDRQVIVKDCSSRMPDCKRYNAVYKNTKGTYRIIFEPDENMLDLIAVRNPRKVIK